MIYGKKISLVLPAYNAEKTLERTVESIPADIVDHIILVDDASSDRTVEIAIKLGLETIRHNSNRGYGGNQKSCYQAALDKGSDIVIMLHPDFQYEPKLIPVLGHMVASGVYDVVLGSRILGREALKGGMPYYKYFFNRALTEFQNLLIGQKLSEYHTGYRAFSMLALTSINWQLNSDDFVFDNQMIAQLHFNDFKIGEVPCPTKYFPDASSVGFNKSIWYGLGVIRTTLQFVLHKLGIYHFPYLGHKVEN